MKMDEIDLVRRLAEAHVRIAWSRVNGSGQSVHLIELDSGHRVAMFHADAMDLASGAASLQQIVERNAGADLGDPWPALEQSAESGACPECNQVGTLRRWTPGLRAKDGAGDASLDVIVCMVCDYADRVDPRWPRSR